MLTGRHVTIAVALGIAVVFGLAGWRSLTGENQMPSSARPVAPSVRTVAPVPPAAADASASLNQIEGAQQVLVDDVQLLQGRVSAQDAEIRRLKDELVVLGRKFDALSAFASTAKETRPVPAVKPPKKKKKRFARRSKKS